MGFFGLGSSGDAGAGSFGASKQALGLMGQDASNLQGLGATGGMITNRFLNPWMNSQQALGDYYQGLADRGFNANQQNTYMGQFGDFVNPYTQASNEAAASAAQRGFGALGGANSVSGSAADYIQAQKAANLQQRLSQMGQYLVQMRPQWMQQAAQAYSQPVSFGTNLAMQGYGQAGNLEAQRAQQYAGLGEQEYQQAMQHDQMVGQGLGQILGLGASIYGMGQYGRMMKGLFGGAAGAVAGGGGGGVPVAVPTVAVGGGYVPTPIGPQPGTLGAF